MKRGYANSCGQDRNAFSLKELPASERPREKIMNCGVQSLSNAELLAVLISSGVKGESALALAGRLLALESGRIGSFAVYQPEEFMKVQGIGVAKACVISAAIELGKRVACSPPGEKVCLDSPSKVAAFFMPRMRYLKKEHLKLALINVKNELIMEDDISKGGISSSSAQPREVFASAVRRGAYAVILVHNHPSGDPTPSDADIRITRQLSEAGKVLGIRVVDHVIVGDGSWVSMAKEGLI
ncbi:MAG: DNA repair protein RadC [Clostridiales bacterium]|nr:DNA repair protein RadC [Clostridiales bacterium]